MVESRTDELCMSAAERECHRPRDPRCSACGLSEGPPRAAHRY